MRRTPGNARPGPASAPGATAFQPVSPGRRRFPAGFAWQTPLSNQPVAGRAIDPNGRRFEHRERGGAQRRGRRDRAAGTTADSWKQRIWDRRGRAGAELGVRRSRVLLCRLHTAVALPSNRLRAGFSCQTPVSNRRCVSRRREAGTPWDRRAPARQGPGQHKPGIDTDSGLLVFFARIGRRAQPAERRVLPASLLVWLAMLSRGVVRYASMSETISTLISFTRCSPSSFVRNASHPAASAAAICSASGSRML